MITYIIAALVFGLVGGIIIRGIYKLVTGKGNSGCGCGCSHCHSECLPTEENK